MNLKIRKIEAEYKDKELVMHYADIYKRTVADVLITMLKDKNISLYLISNKSGKLYLTIKRNRRNIGKVFYDIIEEAKKWVK